MRLNKLRTWSGLIAAAFTVMLLSGCWDKTELEALSFVMCIGLDKGQGSNLDITYVISNPQGGGFGNVIGSSPNEPAQEIITVTCPDVLSTRDLLGATISRQITFSHTKVLAINEELARDGQLAGLIDQFLRDRQIRRDLYMMICREKASEFLRRNNPQTETRIHKFYELMSERWKENELVPLSDINKFVKSYEDGKDLFLCIYGTAKPEDPKPYAHEDEYYAGEINMKGDNPIQLIGSAVLKNGKMIGLLTGEETRLCMHLQPRSTFSSLQATFPDPLDESQRVSIRFIKETNNRFKLDLDGEVPVIDVTVPLLVDILAVPSGVDYATDLQKQELFKEHIKASIEGKARKFIKKTQEEFEGEPFLWSELVRRKFDTWDEYERYDWMEKYPEAIINLNYELSIRRMGKQGESIKKSGTQG